MKQILLSLFFGLGLMLSFSANAQDEIWEHTPSPYKVFKSSGSIFVVKDQLHEGGKIGRDCGQYVIPHDAADDILDWARAVNQDGSVCYNIETIEKSLGVTDGAWDGKTLIRVNLRSEALRELNMRWPAEEDCVPYDQWRDGISHCCGVPIAMIDRVPAEYAIVINKDIKPCKHTAPGIPVPTWFPLPCCVPHCCGCIPIRFPKDVH